MRFGLKTLLIAMGVVGVALFLMFASPNEVAVPLLVLISVSVAALVTTGLVYGRGNIRAFCIGAMIPAGATVIGLIWLLCMWFMSTSFGTPPEVIDFPSLFAHFEAFAFTLRVWSAASWIMGLVAGTVSVAVRMALQPKDAKVPTSPFKPNHPR
jgi:hypothetical protein